MSSMRLLVGLVIYILGSRLTMRRLAGQSREIVLAFFNLAGVFWCFFYVFQVRYSGLLFGLYLVLILFQFVMLQLFADKKSWLPWLAFFAPLAVLVVVRYVPLSFFTAVGQRFGLAWRGNQKFLALVGISYLTFRCSRLVLEVRNGLVEKPHLCEYLNFAFFLPTMPLGPINTYANYRKGFEAQPFAVAPGRAVLRILVGLVKYEFIGGILNQLTYDGFLRNDHLHHWIDLPLAMVFYYLYLYCNFSGFCDMAIGTAALIGIPVPENFDHPFAARNIRDFWNRWHITLSVWMRDVVFSPLSKFLVRVMGTRLVNHAIALTIIVVFLLVGIWHGAGWNFAAYGAIHALGVTVNHYYALFLKKRLGREGFKAYNNNHWIRAAAIVLTFCYCAASLLFFANTFPEIREIFSSLR